MHNFLFLATVEVLTKRTKEEIEIGMKVIIEELIKQQKLKTTKESHIQMWSELINK